MAKKFEKIKNSKRTKEAKRIMKLRRQLELSQAQLAQEWYVSPGTIALWENGNRSIPGPILKLLEIYEETRSLL